MRVMILAAGKGVRLKPLTDRIPKPMMEVGGISLLGRTLTRIASYKPELVVINTYHLADLMIKHVGDGSAWGLNVVWSREEKLLETGGGMCNALHHLGGEPVLVINGDILWDCDLNELLDSFDPRRMDAMLGLVDNPSDKPGDFLPLWNGRLIRASGCGTMTYSGIMVLRPLVLVDYPVVPFSLNRIFDDSMGKGRLFGLPLIGRWMDIGTPHRLDEARNLWPATPDAMNQIKT